MVEATPPVSEPTVHGVELMFPLDPCGAFRPPYFERNLLLVQGRLQLGAVLMRHVSRAVLEPVRPRDPDHLQLVVRERNHDHFWRLGQRRLQGTDLALDLRVFEDVAVHLRERRVAVDETPQQDDELEQIGVGLLPERLFGFAEQVVHECGDRKGDRIRIEVVVQRVVADVAAEPNLRVVRLSPGATEHPSHLLAEVALHFEDESADLSIRIAGAPTEELFGVGIHAGRRLSRADRADNHHAGVEPSLRDREPCRRRRASGCRLKMRLAEHECG